MSTRRRWHTRPVRTCIGVFAGQRVKNAPIMDQINCNGLLIHYWYFVSLEKRQYYKGYIAIDYNKIIKIMQLSSIAYCIYNQDDIKRSSDVTLVTDTPTFHSCTEV